MKEPELAKLMGIMDMVVLKQAEDGRFHLATSSPVWFQRFRPKVFPEGPAFHPERLSPVLEDFMEDARPVWEDAPTAPSRLDSGWWTLQDRDGNTHQMRATAVRNSGQNYLVIEEGARDAALFSALPKYREGMFEHEKLLRTRSEHQGATKQSVEWSPMDQAAGLRNRESFLTEAEGFLQNARLNRRPVYVFVIRPLGLKAIREKSGASEESSALFALSEILRKTFRRNDPRARFPNNAFVVAAMETHFDFRKILEDRLTRNLERFNSDSFKAYELRALVGVARGDYKSGAAMTALIKEADQKIPRKRQAPPARTAERVCTEAPRAAAGLPKPSAG